MSFSNYLEDELLDHVFGNAAFPSPTTVYLALYTVAPTDAGGGTEVPTANGYARQAVTFGTASGGTILSSAVTSFTAAGGDWGTIAGGGIWDAASGGNFLATATIPSAIVNDGTTLSFGIGAVQVDLD